jgi:hypothetical protein
MLCEKAKSRQVAYRSEDHRQRKDKEKLGKGARKQPTFHCQYGVVKFAVTFVPGNNRLKSVPYVRQRKTALSGSYSRKLGTEIS